MSLTQQAQQIIHNHFSNKKQRIAIDATCGNGHDTQFLCGLGFDQVIAFDIQAQAIEQTQQRLQQHQLNAKLIQTGHENMMQYIEGEVDCVMFNFGYLPKADKSLTTKTNTSLKALTIALNALSKTGLISLMCYPGHPEGAIETESIKKHLKLLGEPWRVECILASTPRPTAPILYLIKKQP